jgi:hypothetical protein
MSRRSLPLITRAMSSRSSTSRSCEAAFLSMTSSACDRERMFGCVRRMRVQPRTALSGVLISCDSVARNSSFRRDASSATWRARSDTEIWLRSSRSLITRSVTSSITVIVPTTRVPESSGAMRALCAISVSPAVWKLREIGSRYLWKRSDSSRISPPSASR